MVSSRRKHLAAAVSGEVLIRRLAADSADSPCNLCNLWFRLQGVGVRGRKCATYETLPLQPEIEVKLFL